MARLTFRFSKRVTNNIPEDAEAELNAGMYEAIASSTRMGRELTQATTPRRTGYTASTVDSQITGGGSHVTGYFGSDYEVFDYLERGTRAHPIRGNPWLYWPGARHPVRMVRHPGTQGQHMLERAGETAGEHAKGELEDVFRRVFG